mmetsp:Transcript_13593/g.24231  ORF Transcript_13593/g.24231 Transcript_13593/m.24231 type:complete len:212 (+) Transcript_13593:2173-2808(+)
MSRSCWSSHSRRDWPSSSRARTIVASGIWNMNPSVPSERTAIARDKSVVAKALNMASLGASSVPIWAWRLLLARTLCCIRAWMTAWRYRRVRRMSRLLMSCRSTSTCFLRSSTSSFLPPFFLASRTPSSSLVLFSSTASISYRCLALLAMTFWNCSSCQSASCSSVEPSASISENQNWRKLCLRVSTSSARVQTCTPEKGTSCIFIFASSW